MIDVRTKNEHHLIKGAITGSRCRELKSRRFERDMQRFDKKKPMIFYSFTDARSTKAAELLKELGFSQIYILDEGLKNWIAKKYQKSHYF